MSRVLSRTNQKFVCFKLRDSAVKRLRCLDSCKKGIRSCWRRKFSAVYTMGSNVIDLRSDTVTKPSKEMRTAMFEAEVGDDIYGEDPTVIELQQKIAALLGKEAALFVPSGTMANLIAVMVHCDRRGSEVMMGDMSHIFLYEQGGVSQLGGVHTRLLKTNPDGTIDLDEIVRGIRKDKIHEPKTQLLCIENTHNRCGGCALPLSYLTKLGALRQQIKLPVHLDGARIFNAAAYHKVTAAELCKDVDTVNVCFSKGLGAPIGSALVGPNTFIGKAVRIRKALGGGMRQVGVIAAACIYALNNMVTRMEQDHEHVRLIAEAIQAVGGDRLIINMEYHHTNILLMNLSPLYLNSQRFCQRLTTVTEDEKNALNDSIIVKVYPFDTYQVRAVLHADISREDVDKAIKKFKYVLEEPVTTKKMS